MDRSVVLVLLIVLLVAAVIYSPTIGAWPSSGLGLVLVVLLVLALMGRL